MVPVLCSHPLKTRSINKYIWDALWPPCAEEAGGPQSKEKTAGHEPGAREGRADRTRGPDWPQGGQARFPWAVRGYSQGNLTSLSLGTAKLAPGGAPWPSLVTRRHSSAHPCTCVLDP